LRHATSPSRVAQPLGQADIHPPRDTRQLFVIDPSGNLLRIGTRIE